MLTKARSSRAVIVIITIIKRDGESERGSGKWATAVGTHHLDVINLSTQDINIYAQQAKARQMRQAAGAEASSQGRGVEGGQWPLPCTVAAKRQQSCQSTTNSADDTLHNGQLMLPQREGQAGRQRARQFVATLSIKLQLQTAFSTGLAIFFCCCCWWSAATVAVAAAATGPIWPRPIVAPC